MEEFYRESTLSSILGQSILPHFYVSTSSNAARCAHTHGQLLTPTCAFLRITGKRARHEELLPPLSGTTELRRRGWGGWPGHDE
jgi:hypothetical protein